MTVSVRSPHHTVGRDVCTFLDPGFQLVNGAEGGEYLIQRKLLRQVYLQEDHLVRNRKVSWKERLAQIHPHTPCKNRANARTMLEVVFGLGPKPKGVS